ncbi:MAG: efflux RND transporter periplasmic adaptor subunit [Chloroflexi bacterium]|nr:efflux RND transporter periplasmic adaptor subunit [Chloroflexota bacterium]
MGFIKPQRLKEKISALGRGKLVLAVAVVVMAGGAVWYFAVRPAMVAKASDGSETQIHTTVVRQGDISIVASGTGTLTSANSVDLSFSTAGTVSELDVAVGDLVSKGDVLAKMGNTTTLQANVAQAEVTLLEAQQTLQDLYSGSEVALAQAYVDWVAAKQSLADAQEEYQRLDYSRCSQDVNTKYAQQLERAKETLAKLINVQGSDAWIEAKNDYDTAQANYSYCEAYTGDEKAEITANYELAQATLKKAEQSYDDLKQDSGLDVDQQALAEANVEKASADLELAKKDLEGATLVAPIDGTVISITAGEGEMVDTSAYITIADMQNPYLEVSVDEADIALFKTGYETEIIFDAYPDLTFSGKVIQVDPSISTSSAYSLVTGLVEIDSIQALNGQPLMLGMSASVDVISQKAENVLLVPDEALRKLDENEYAVFVLGSDGNLRLRTVQVGIDDTTYAEIKEGLSAGERVSTGLVETK